MSETTRYKLTIEYNGAPYSGWQRQADVISVQEEVEKAIAAIIQQPVTIHVAGRTDAGVHAKGQVIHVDLPPFKRPMEPFEIAKAINAHLRPQPISVIGTEIVSDDFHARFAARNKLYLYRIIRRGAFLTHDQGLAWQFKKPLDVKAMREGAKHLIGHHDFTSFRDSQCQAKSPMRTLARLEISTRPYDVCGGIEIRIEVEGRSFLHHQVRNMVGTLALVGEGKWQADDVRKALEAKDRTAAGPTCPADGLYLMRVDY